MTDTAETHAPETHAFGAEVGKVLHLMIHSLYTNKDIFLRELVSNAADACDKLRYLALTAPSLTEGDPDLKITLRVDETARTVTVADNGIGMNRDELIANLGTIARSGTQEFLTQLEKTDSPALIGQFGVGFYAAFMVADRVTVDSRKAGEDAAWRWESTGDGTFTVTPANAAFPRGTSITLHLREEAGEYLDPWKLRHIVETYSDHVGAPIYLLADEGPEQLNTAAALWTRPKSEITEEQYNEFYHAVAHMPDSPWLTLHTRAEGKVEYTSLLYIPSRPPFDLFHPDRKRRVKLYVKRVFISEENVDLIPQWLRFLRGVVDSYDLPLNVSRETLQHNAILAQIRDDLIRRILAELKKRAQKDAESYDGFWKHFGAVLKEGLCEAITDKERILEVCRFHSTHAEGFTSLDDYIARMKTGQDDIYYLTAETLEAARKSPQLEGFASRGIEVLLLPDHVDSFWLSVVNQYKGKTLRSATRADVDLSAFAADTPAETPEAARDADVSVAVTRLKDILGAEVADVRASTRLTESPVCLVAGAGGMDMRMERFMAEHKQLPGLSAKILEINPVHPVILRIATHPDAPETDRLARLLLDQARLLAGEPIPDPAGFARRLNEVLAA